MTVIDTQENPGLQRLDASKLIYTFTKEPRHVPDRATAHASEETVCTDHMIQAKWHAATGWSVPELKPYGPLALMPTASCLHYATECFEGLKVYRGHDGKLRLFRTDCNDARLRMSASRISLPSPDPEQLPLLIQALVAVDGPKWLPETESGTFLYIRPCIIGTHPNIGIKAPKSAILYIIMSYMAPLDTLSGGMKLLTSPADMIRSWAGGFGHAKIGANYGPSVLASQAAARAGFHQILWLYGENKCTEAGSSNFFVVWRRKDGMKEVLTAPLDGLLILDGVTRRSCLELARDRLGEEYAVTERNFTIDELIEAAVDGRLLEAFAAGTAWFITPISQIRHRDHDINLTLGEHGQPGEVTSKIKGWLTDIMYGKVEHQWATVIPDKGV